MSFSGLAETFETDLEVLPGENYEKARNKPYKRRARVAYEVIIIGRKTDIEDG